MKDRPALDDKVGHPSPARARIGAARLFATLVVPPLIFAAQVTASFTIADSACTRSLLPIPALVAYNLVSFLLLGLLLILAFANRRAVAHEKSDTLRDLHDRGGGRTAFLAEFGVTMSALFVAVSLFELIGVLLLGTCVGFAPSV